MTFWQVAGGTVLGLLMIYLVARLIFTAYFLSKQQNEDRRKYHGGL